MIRLDPFISFFMSRQETEALLNCWLRASDLYCVLSRPLPFEFQSYVPDDTIALSQNAVAWLDISPFPLQPRNGGDIAMANRECLQLRFPTESEGTLIAGSLGSLVRTSPRYELWSLFAQGLCDVTFEGMWVRNVTSGKLTPAPKYRYSQQAKLLHGNGIRLCEASGAGVYSPEKPATSGGL